MSLLTTAVLTAIRFYQRWMSPHKGFRCAYGVHTGRCGCSELGYRAIRRFGLMRGWGVLRDRTGLCAEVHRRPAQTHPPLLRRPHARERGDCDCGVLPCDLDAPPLKKSLQLFSCCDVGHCDWGSRKDRRVPRRQRHIPPFSDRRSRGQPSDR